MKKLLLAVALLSIGCSSYDLTTPTQETLAGRWALKSVDGNRLPYNIPVFATTRRELMEDVLTLTSSSTFTEVTVVRVTQAGQTTTETVTEKGTYAFNSYAIDFTYDGNATFASGTLQGKQMTIITSGITFVFEKQN